MGRDKGAFSKILTALKRIFSRESKASAKSDERIEFQGTACVMISDVARFGSTAAQITPAKAVQLTADILDHQLRVVAKHGGMVDQFVGCSVVSYWLPDESSSLVSRATAAAREMVASVPNSSTFPCCLKVGFSVAECARAVFGSNSSFRIQVVGRARSRAEAALNSLSSQSGIAIDPETFALLLESDRSLFQREPAGNYVLVQR